MSIMKSTDNVSVELEKIFNLSKTPSKTEIISARNRKELGNPPGKATDPLGDQLSWEQFLAVYDDKEIWIITNDSDFISEYENRFYLNPFLYNELKKNKNTPKINLFRSLPDGIKDYDTKSDHQMETIPSDEEMREIKIEETEILRRNKISSSNIMSIGYDHKNSTLEVEFISGAVYQYSGVPEEVYQGLMSAGSHGKYFDQYVKKAGYPFVKIG